MRFQSKQTRQRVVRRGPQRRSIWHRWRCTLQRSRPMNPHMCLTLQERSWGSYFPNWWMINAHGNLGQRVRCEFLCGLPIICMINTTLSGSTVRQKPGSSGLSGYFLYLRATICQYFAVNCESMILLLFSIMIYQTEECKYTVILP